MTGTRSRLLHPSNTSIAAGAADPRERADTAHVAISRAQLDLLRAIGEVDREGSWRDDGARDVAHWVSMRYGVSGWKAHRWVRAAHAIDALPVVTAALTSGTLGIDAVVELTRFATPATESRLVAWARGVSPAAVRRRADREARRDHAAVDEAERDRFLDWWYSDEGRRVGLHGELPADRGAIVVRALESLAADVPVLPDEESEHFDAARRADALVAICEGRPAEARVTGAANGPASDQAGGRAPTLLIHTTLRTLLEGVGSAEVDEGPLLDASTVQRLACDGKLQVVLEDDAGNPFRLGRVHREPSLAMLRALRFRDRECRFPGCGATRFTNAHHIEWWSRGGRTDLENLLLLCSFHHRLVHERGWGVKVVASGEVLWFRPDGVRYRAGPAPPIDDPVPTHIAREPCDRGSPALVPLG